MRYETQTVIIPRSPFTDLSTAAREAVFTAALNYGRMVNSPGSYRDALLGALCEAVATFDALEGRRRALELANTEGPLTNV